MRRHEPLLAKTLALNFAPDVFDVAIRHPPTWLNQDVLEIVTAGTGPEVAAGELLADVGMRGTPPDYRIVLGWSVAHRCKTKLARFFDVSATPATGCHLLAGKQRARATRFFGLAGI
jgi:hypothetical protein